MEDLIESLSKELGISKKKAMDVVEAIADYVQHNHPALNVLTQDILRKEMDKQKNGS
jgi:nucleoid DNA-binding protein